MSRFKVALAVVVLTIPLAGPGTGAPVGSVTRSPAHPVAATKSVDGRVSRRVETRLPKGFVPAVAVKSGVGRYFIVMKAPGVAQRVSAARLVGKPLSGPAQRHARSVTLGTQRAALAQARDAGGKIVFRYSTLINGFSAALSPSAARSSPRGQTWLPSSRSRSSSSTTPRACRSSVPPACGRSSARRVRA